MRKPRIAIQGIAASFHDEAARNYFGNDIEIIECNSFKTACMVLSENMADYCIMAIENSIAGSILTNYNLISEHDLTIIGETYLRIQLHLMALSEVSIKEIKHVQSHPMALNQCQEYLANYPAMQLLESFDTAGCAKQIKEENMKWTAAIASEQAAIKYGLKILQRNIETNERNYTRFYILAKGNVEEAHSDKATLAFELDHSPGSLAHALKILEKNFVNVSKIQSVPIIGKPNQYRFYLDIEWLDKMLYKKCLNLLKKKTSFLSVLGKYKKGEM